MLDFFFFFFCSGVEGLSCLYEINAQIVKFIFVLKYLTTIRSSISLGFELDLYELNEKYYFQSQMFYAAVTSR